MIQAHIDQLHEAVGSIPKMRFGSTGNNGSGGGRGDGGLGYHNTDGSVQDVLLSQPQQGGQVHLIHLTMMMKTRTKMKNHPTMMMMIAVAAENQHEGEDREIAEIMTVVDQGYRGRKPRESTHLHGRRSRSWTAGRWHSP